MIEKLAHMEHESWANWMTYLFSKSVANPDGSVTIPKGLVDRWQYQARTVYADLTEREKDSDRIEVSKIVPIIIEFADR